MADSAPYQIDLSTLTAFIEDIGSHHYDLIYQVRSGQKPLYHYTDLVGLKGIVEGHDLWLTNASYLNDAEEMTHGRSVARDVIANTPVSGPLGTLYRDQLADSKGKSEGVYVCCFCEKDNLLSQWRGYGANGTGVSLELDPLGFASMSGPDFPPGLGTAAPLESLLSARNAGRHRTKGHRVLPARS